ncbi:hypothetical protein RM764_46430, partial [Streptomyces sp. DSM 41699]|nr:hypothetical protein [Streptomyces sp. DSM 41699]
MYLVVIQSVFTAVSGSRLRWQRMERYGSLQAPASTESPRFEPIPRDPGSAQPTPDNGLAYSAPYDGHPQP